MSNENKIHLITEQINSNDVGDQNVDCEYGNVNCDNAKVSSMKCTSDLVNDKTGKSDKRYDFVSSGEDDDRTGVFDSDREDNESHADKHVVYLDVINSSGGKNYIIDDNVDDNVEHYNDYEDDLDDDDDNHDDCDGGDDYDDDDIHYERYSSNACRRTGVKDCDDCEDSESETDNHYCTSDYVTCREYNSDGIVEEEGIHLNDIVETNENREKSVIYSNVHLIKRCDTCKSQKYENIMNMLEEFQTESKWEKHKCLTSCLQKSETDVDLRIVLFLEQGMAEIMQKQISLGKSLFRQALKLSSQSKNISMLRGRALMFLGNAYRKQGPKKFGKAFRCLTLAQQNLCIVESQEDKAELNYFLGALFLNLLSISTHEPSKRSRERIEKHYQAVYDYAMNESASRVREKIQRIFPLGMANFLLDSQTEIARSRVVSESKLKKAEDCLKYFARHFPFEDQSVSIQTDYLKSVADLQCRRGNFRASQEFLVKGLEIATCHKYNLEVQSFEKRMAMLKKCLPRQPLCLPQEDNADFADQSATFDSEISIFGSGTE